MVRKIRFSPSCVGEDGLTFLTLVIALVPLIGLASFVVDIGQARQQQRFAQNVADAATLSAVELIRDNASVDQLRNDAHRIVIAHGFTDANIYGGWNAPSGGALNSVNSGGIVVGTWNDATNPKFTPDTSSARNAVRVALQRDVKTQLALIYGVTNLIPKVTSIARLDSRNGAVDCPLPFTVEKAGITSGGNLIPTGTVFTTGFAAPGNWGTFRQSGCDFFCAINGSGGACGTPLSVGDQPTTDPGNPNQIRDAFNAHVGSVYTIPIANAIPNGASQPFTVLGFIQIQVVGASGSGSHATYTFRLLEYVVGSGTGSNTTTLGSISKERILVQ